jgi:hypothetical protein
VPETANEAQHRVGKDTILALSLVVSGIRGVPAHRDGLYVVRNDNAEKYNLFRQFYSVQHVVLSAACFS